MAQDGVRDFFFADHNQSEVLPRYARRTREVDEATLGPYLSGANSRRIRRVLKPLLGEEHLSKSAVSRVVSRLKERFEQWQKRDLSEEAYAIVFLDGFHLKVRMAKRVVSVPVLAALGVAPDGQKTAVVVAGGGERSFDALGLSARRTSGPRTMGPQAGRQRRPQGSDEGAREVAGVSAAAVYRAQAFELAQALPSARTARASARLQPDRLRQGRNPSSSSLHETRHQVDGSRTAFENAHGEPRIREYRTIVDRDRELCTKASL